jgi:uncharacterized protein YegJ (DUF2314 family)
VGSFAYIKEAFNPKCMNWFRRLFGKKEKHRVSRRRDNADVYHVSNEAERMNWAIEKARLTLLYFKSSITTPKPFQTYFSLKARIEDGTDIEHLWLNDLSFDDANIFYGTVANEPIKIHNVSLGKQIGVPYESISDWMIIEDGILIGGYTIRAIRDGLPEKDKKIFDQQTGFTIDEGVDYFEHDFSTPEGAILCIEDAYDAHDINRVMACKDFEAEARLMLSHTKHMERLASKPEIITETEEAVKLTFIKFIDDHGFPSFKNVKRAFPHREFVREDLCIVTEVCRYPDQTKSRERLYVSRKNGEWKVLNPVD